ncbi:transcription antitermination factor NusB [uncultured Eubacterium sp.]|uniref:transcription antitermination factor NusB n=1 Tax=uncultured Eubacterium sp. TaxID=165185 RepID=UPI0025DE7548|nr:transcription antitermination factor NusB [uncultured Eubacterium sp.]
MKNSRLTAFEVINGVLRENAYSNLSLEKALDGAENKDKAFVTRLVYGILERKLTLDYVINIYLKSKTKPKIKILLYMGTYQILFMDKVPDSAAVNETLKLADELGLSFYKKVINAVLRKVCAEKNTVLDNVSLDIKYSCPQKLNNNKTKKNI